MFMPLRGGPNEAVSDWLAKVNGEPLLTGLRQRDIRRWKRQTPGHRSFTVVTHPVVRAHSAFVRRILRTGEDGFPEIRAALRDRHNVPLPETEPGPEWTNAQHHAAFLGFLKFLKGNLGGQTSLRIDADWASQAGLLQHLAEVMVPDAVMRAEELETDLPSLVPDRPVAFKATPADRWLSDVYDSEIEAAAKAAYPRDYMMFGYSAWVG